MKRVAVIGLGAMGSTLARLLIETGFEVHIWNRSPGRTADLEARGAVSHSAAASAIAASDAVVICVHDYAATNEVLSGPGVADAVGGRTLIQLTTGGPDDAREGLAWVEAHGATYLDGAIQVAPSQMGLPDTTVLISGDPAVLEAARPVLSAFGGNIVNLGPSVAAAAAMDLATLSYVYGSVLGFFQGILFVEAEGMDLARYAAIVRDMGPAYGEFMTFEADRIAKRDYAVAESPLEISVSATARIAEAARKAGFDSRLSTVAADLLAEADRAGHAKKEVAALIEVMRG